MEEKDSTGELVVVDVDRYKRVKKALKESEERYRKLFENVPIGIYRSTPEGRFIDANPALIRMLGYGSFEELAARDLEKEYFDVHHPRSHYIDMLKREGELKGLESVWRRKDNTLIHIRENVKLIRGDDGQVYYEGTVEDITQSKLAEEAQRIHTQQIEILNSIISRGNLAESLEEMLATIIDCVAAPLALDTVAIFLYDAEAQAMELRASRGGKKGFHLDDKYMSVERMPFSQVLRGQPVFVDNVPDTLPDLAEQWGWRMASSIPLLSKGRVIGALAAASCQRDSFSSEERSTLLLVGKEAGMLVSKLQTETALRESEKYYRTLIDLSPDIIIVLGLDGNLGTVSQRFLKVGGYSHDDVIGHNVLEFVPGLDETVFKEGIQRFMEARRIDRVEYPVRKKDGALFPLEMALTLLTDERGAPAGIMGVGRDISERKQAETALRESEEKFRSITEQTSDLIAITDAGGVITYASSASRSLFHCEPEEMLGLSFDEFLDAPSIPRARAAFQGALARGEKTVNLELAMKRKDGSVFPGELNGSSFQFRDQHGSLVVIRDVSERKRAQEQLRFLSSITENTTDAIMVTDTDFFITYINKVGEQFFGYSLEELQGKTPGIFNAEPTAMQIQKEIYEAVASGQTFLGESLNRRKDGSTFYCEYKVMPLRGDDGTIRAYFSVQRDISERKRNEAVLRQSEETFRLTFEAIPSPAYIWARQADGRIVLSRFNQAALAITRGRIKDYLGIEVRTLYAGHPDFADKIERVMNTGQRLNEEVLYRYQSTGESKWLVIDYVRTAVGNVLVITRDVSERKEAEAKLLAYQEQLRAMSLELTLVEERERRRIAAELHDQIGQNLALCKLKVAALESVEDRDPARGELSAVRRLLECSIQDARSLIFDLSPPVLYELGFPAALEWLAERVGEQYRVPVEFENRAAGACLEDDRRVILFQIVRELLINMGKHSRAGRAKVILAREEDALKIQVNDDGVGFDASGVADPVDRKGGFGFFSMRERLNYLGGVMEVRSKPGQGSQVVLSVPLAPATAAAKKENA